MTVQLMNLRVARSGVELPPEAVAVAVAEVRPAPLRWEAECSGCGITLRSGSSVVTSELGPDNIPTGLSVVAWWEDENDTTGPIPAELLRMMRLVFATAHATEAHPGEQVA